MPPDHDLYEHVCAVLFEIWDPIGINTIAPCNEYDSYATYIIQMIREGADESEVVAHLGRLARESMGLSYVDESRDRIVAMRLIELVGSTGSGQSE